MTREMKMKEEKRLHNVYKHDSTHVYRIAMREEEGERTMY
jgi:hypothetical protein